MDEPSSEDSDFIDSMMALIDREGIVRKYRLVLNIIINTTVGSCSLCKWRLQGKNQVIFNVNEMSSSFS